MDASASAKASSAKPPKKLGSPSISRTSRPPGGRAWAWRTRWWVRSAAVSSSPCSPRAAAPLSTSRVCGPRAPAKVAPASSSATTTSARPSRSQPRRVSRPGSPGPAPTKTTEPSGERVGARPFEESGTPSRPMGCAHTGLGHRSFLDVRAEALEEVRPHPRPRLRPHREGGQLCGVNGRGRAGATWVRALCGRRRGRSPHRAESRRCRARQRLRPESQPSLRQPTSHPRRWPAPQPVRRQTPLQLWTRRPTPASQPEATPAYRRIERDRHLRAPR